MFDRNYLKSVANSNSYSRGQQYFKQDCVGKISHEAGMFTAKVRGSRQYKVKLTLQPRGAKFRCSCPYNYDGICKHAVALGLAVLQKFGSELVAESEPDTSPQALGKALRDTAAAIQLAFLADLLRGKPKLRRQFLLHLAPATAKAPAVETAAKAPAAAAAEPTTIEEVSTEVYEALSDLVFDDDTLGEEADDYEQYLYDESGDMMLELADSLIREVLEPFAQTVADALGEGRLTTAMKCWVGVYEGAMAATEPAAQDYELFSYEGYPARVLGCWDELLHELGADELLGTRPFAPAETEAALALLFGRYAAVGYPPDYFAALLAALNHDPVVAAQLRPHLEATAWPLSLDQAQVLLHTAEVLADDALWVRTAEAHAGQDFGLLQRLLDHYRQHNDRPNLLRLLRQYQEQFSRTLNPYVLEHVALTEDEALYLAALEQRCRTTRTIADYALLRPHWSAKRRREFVEEQVKLSRNMWTDPLFGAELLVSENREAELLAYLLKLDWTGALNVPKLLALTARTQPDACLDAVMERTEETLANGRGRDVYQRITSWLAALNQIETLRPQVALFAAHLYTEYVRLNALREELRAAKLVKTHQVGKQHRLVPPTPEDDELRELLRDRKKK